MKQRIFSHFQDYLIQYISHQYQDLLYCNSSQYILSTYNSQHNNNNNVVLAMTMPYCGQGRRHSAQHYYINIWRGSIVELGRHGRKILTTGRWFSPYTPPIELIATV